MYAVQRKQIGDVALLEPGTSQLKAADLGVRGADRVTRVLAGDLAGLAKPAKLGADEHAEHGRSRLRRGGNADRVAAHSVARTHFLTPTFTNLDQTVC